ncbi:MAG: hypothetical protein DMF90_03645 [Acidobacteria bacterium]|nr:MAG: hypothetical protein DMF90_03645 [Acidobacteriota bacterium]
MMSPALHADTLVMARAELPHYQEKLPELKPHVGDRERDQFISRLTERLRSAPAATPQRPASLGKRVLAALTEFFF